MHDLAAMTALIDRLTAGPAPTRGAVEVHIRAGAAFSDEALGQAFEMLVQGSPLEGSRLVVEPSRDEHACVACGARWVIAPDDLAGHVLLCRTCGAASAIEHGSRLELIDVRARNGGCGPSAPPC